MCPPHVCAVSLAEPGAGVTPPAALPADRTRGQAHTPGPKAPQKSAGAGSAHLSVSKMHADPGHPAQAVPSPDAPGRGGPAELSHLLSPGPAGQNRQRVLEEQTNDAVTDTPRSDTPSGRGKSVYTDAHSLLLSSRNCLKP